MPLLRLADLTWEEVRPPTVAILPIGAVEAHGPHLPMCTDGIIAEAMARAAAARLSNTVLLLPTVPYATAPFAAAFPGTISIRAETATAIIVDVARELARHGIGSLAIANAHLDPTHLASLHAAVETIRSQRILRIAFPDLTRKPWASRLTDEFKSGACHAGRFESSIVLAERPDLVREAVQTTLPVNPASLSRAIREGKSTFEEAGGPRAYFGDPAAATAEEGRRTIEIIGTILAESLETELL